MVIKKQGMASLFRALDLFSKPSLSDFCLVWWSYSPNADGKSKTIDNITQGLVCELQKRLFEACYSRRFTQEILTITTSDRDIIQFFRMANGLRLTAPKPVGKSAHGGTSSRDNQNEDRLL
jgi:hypothetical protein